MPPKRSSSSLVSRAPVGALQVSPLASRIATAAAPADFESLERLRSALYEVGKVVARFDSVEQLLSELVESLREGVSQLFTAVLLEERSGRRSLRTWQAPGGRRAQLQRAERRARTVHDYLVRPSPLSLPLGPRPSPHGSPSRGSGGSFVTLPLVGSDERVFGVFQVETGRALDELSLAFLSAATHQLALALERHDAFVQEVELRRRAEALERIEKQLRLRERAARLAAEQSKRRLAFLAEASALLAASLDYERTLPQVARLAVRRIADGCAIVLDGLEGDCLRRIVNVREGLSTERASDQFARIVAKVGEHDALAVDPAESPMDGARSVTTTIGVPLRTRGERIGVLALVCLRPQATFGPEDVTQAEDFARRLAMTVDNARLYREAQRAIASRESLLAVVSHDLKTPLSSIVMSAGLLLAGAPGTERRRRGRRQLEGILRSAERMKHLVRDLLDVAQIEARHLLLRRGFHPVVEILDEAAQLVTPLAAEKSIELRTAVDGELPQVYGDRDRILQVLSNLLSNAIKFTPAGGQVALSASNEPPSLRFTVRDSGPGISPQDVPNLFGKFWQAEQTAHLGNGLGLFISKGIVDAHGGRIWVENLLDSGAAFHFTLPCAG